MLAPRPEPDVSSSIQDAYRRLAGRGSLLPQQHASLACRGLLVPDGGLCCSTCATNGLLAGYDRLGKLGNLRLTSDELLHQIVWDVKQTYNKDARVGLDFGCASESVKRVASQLVDGACVNACVPYWRQGDGKALQGDRNHLAVWAVDTGKRRNGQDGSHAIVVLGVNAARRLVEYSDPNYPNTVKVSGYQVGGGGRIYLNDFNGPNGGTGELLDLMHLGARKSDPRYVERFGRFSGSRAWVTYRSGDRRLASISRVKGPSAEYPAGSLSAYSYCFGSGGGGACGLEEIAAIEPATAKPASTFEKYVNKDVRVSFSDPSWKRQYGETPFKVLGIDRTRHPDHHPFGGLRVSFKSSYSSREGVIPFEAIDRVQAVATAPSGR